MHFWAAWPFSWRRWPLRADENEHPEDEAANCYAVFQLPDDCSGGAAATLDPASGDRAEHWNRMTAIYNVVVDIIKHDLKAGENPPPPEDLESAAGAEAEKAIARARDFFQDSSHCAKDKVRRLQEQYGDYCAALAADPSSYIQRHLQDAGIP